MSVKWDPSMHKVDQVDYSCHGGSLPEEVCTKRGERRKNSPKKGKDKAKAKLEVRIKDYEAMVKGSSTGGIEFTKPGSLKPS
jgi:hypothetical protein